MAEIISIRELARRVGLSAMAVSKAVSSGRLSKCVVEGGKIDFDKALREMDEINFGGDKRTKGPQPTQQPETDYEPPTRPKQKSKPSFSDNDIADDTSYKEAMRLEKVYKARLLKQESDEKEGTLVNKEDVYRELYTRGDQLKTVLLAIPDRNTDELISIANNRSEFHSRLAAVIEDALRDFSYKS